MIRIAFVEDDENYRKQYSEFLKRYAAESKQHFDITEFTDGDEIVEDYKAKYDIILMDIEMTFMNGMKAAEEIRKLDTEVVIIFITNMPQYVMEGYKVEAFDYILKPIVYYAFSQCIDRAIRRMEKRTRQYITISIKNGIQRLDISEIEYIEVQNHDLVYHTLTESYLTRGSIKEVENTLKNYNFFRCNNCYLINLEYVERVQNSEVVLGNHSIAVSRSRRKELMDALNNYLNEVSK